MIERTDGVLPEAVRITVTDFLSRRGADVRGSQPEAVRGCDCAGYCDCQSSGAMVSGASIGGATAGAVSS